MPINEVHLQTESGVIEELNKLPMYNNYVSLEDKKKSTYFFLEKPVTEWNLVCEEQMSRNELIAELKSTEESSLNVLSTPKWFAAPLLLLPILTLIYILAIRPCCM